AEAPLFPFSVSYDAPENATNISSWIEAPAGKHGFVGAQGDTFVVQPEGKEAQPIRFWATNLCFSACFPEHDQAERMAARMARLGINCVRMHHMDSRDIWGKSGNLTTIDPGQLDRLDYLVAQLKRHGIYTNLNLHVSRTLGEKEGFPHRDLRPKYDKGLDNFEPRMIELQKKYARDLLTHVNPYTKNPYTREPAIAFVEINNENALFMEWGRGALDNLPDPYGATFRNLWNDWLKKKYGSTEKLRKAWNMGAQPLGKELIAGGDFRGRLGREWQLQNDKQSKAEMQVAPTGPGGKNALVIRVETTGTASYIPQVNISGFGVQKDSVYTLSFQARADQQREISLLCRMAHAPWQSLGFSDKVTIGPDWKEFKLSFVAQGADDNARLTVGGLEAGGTYGLADFSLRPGGVFGLEADQKLENRTVPIVTRKGTTLTDAARSDWIDFLWQTEYDYWTGMYRFLKNDLGVRSLVAGTQMRWSPPTIQAELDYVDAHSYWNHPAFPGRPWDSKNWTVKNIALVNNLPGTLGLLASQRVLGKGYTISEYNHPNPNSYAAEGFPMIAAFGRLQGWNGVYSFTYSHNKDELEIERLATFFNIMSDTVRLVHMPASAAMFLRGDVAPAQRVVAAPLSRAKELEILRKTGSARNVATGELGVDPMLGLEHAIGLKIVPDGDMTRPSAAADADLSKKVWQSDTGELRWDVSQEGAGTFTVDTPRTKLFTGFPKGRMQKLGGVEIAVGPTRLGWATVSLVCLDGPGFDQPGRVLIAATAATQNTGWEMQQLADDKVTVSNRWGKEPVLCEGVPAAVTLPVSASRVKLYALDESGSRHEPVPVAGGARAELKLDPRLKTVWYEVEIK
ncbi:MAG: carbohydrate binding domain-containing protein, partial [Planctomycetota bacterium]